MVSLAASVILLKSKSGFQALRIDKPGQHCGFIASVIVLKLVRTHSKGTFKSVSLK